MTEYFIAVLFMCCMAGIILFGGIAVSDFIEEKIYNVPETYYSYTGEIIDVHFIPKTFMFRDTTKTIIQFKDGKVLELYDISTEIHVSSNATVTYFKSAHTRYMIFTNITYENQ